MTRALLRNPALTLGVATAVLFATARIPTEIFYDRFGVRPEEVGLNSVQVLLQGSTSALLISLAIGVVYGLLMPILMFVYVALMEPLFIALRRLVGKLLPGEQKWLTRPAKSVALVKAIRRAARLGPILVPVMSVSFAVILLSFAANNDADAVRSGLPINAQLAPWRAEPVEVTWSGDRPRLELPDCRTLFYLGEGNGRVVIFDSKNDATYRINSQNVELTFPELCSPKSAGRF